MSTERLTDGALAPLPAEARDRVVLMMLWTAAAILIALVWVHVTGLARESRATQLTIAERDLGNLTRVGQEHANRTLRSADQVIRFIQSRYLEIGDRLDIAALTRDGVIDTEIFNQVGVIDKNGIYILSNQPTVGRLDLSDREHFKVHVAADTGGLFVSKPVLGRASGKWSIQLTRRITGPGGAFAGVVVVSIDPLYFTRFYGDLQLGPQGLAALYGLDGVARARRVGTRDDYGANAVGSAAFASGLGNETSGARTSRSVIDGIERMYHYRRIPGYQLAMVAGIDTDYLLASHRNATSALYVQATLVSLLILALAAALSRHLRQMRKESTARRATQLLVEDRKEQLDAIFAMSPDGFVSFDRDRRVNFVNRAFTQMTSPGEIALEHMPEQVFWSWLSARCDPSTPLPAVEDMRLPSGNVPAHEMVKVKLAGGHRILQVGLRSSTTSSVSQILYFRDVTHETEVEQLKSEFLATAAHELRTPMASIFGFSEVLLADDFDKASQQEFLEIIHTQSKLMVNILDELLDLARIEARRGTDFDYTRICLQDLARDLVRSFKCPPGRTPPAVTMPEPPVYVLADDGKLRQAILNVLVNAYKFSPAGRPVTMDIAIVQKDPDRQAVAVHIRDEGIGMTPDQVDKVCMRFYRSDTSGQVSGAGLGMSIVKEIIELHQGEVAISSILGQGTRVSLLLPIQAPPVGPGNTIPA